MPRSCSTRWWIGVALALVAMVSRETATGARPAPSQGVPQFRASTDLVVQAVTVRDRQGLSIRGLAADDFLVTEDGKPQTVAFVDYQEIDATPLPESIMPLGDIALTLPGVPVAAIPEVTRAAARMPSAANESYRGRRLLVFYLDLLGLTPFDRARIFEGASAYVEKRMTTADMVAVMTWSGGSAELRVPFTDDRVVLGRALRQLELEADRGEIGDAGGTAFGEDGGGFGLFDTDRQLSALQAAANDLGTIPQTKTLLYFGSGLARAGLENLAQLRATVNAAVRAGVTLNPIDARGLRATPPLGDASRPSSGGVGMFSGATSQRMNLAADRARDILHALANDSGGRAIVDNNDLAQGVATVASAVTGYYLIGYYTTNTLTNGRYRRVKVELTGPRSATLSYRQGYFAAKDYRRFNAFEKEQQLSEALAFDDPITEIPMAAEVNYFRIGAAEHFVPISVRMPGSELARLKSDGSLRAEIDVIGEIKDEHGTTMRNMRDRVEFSTSSAGSGHATAPLIQYEAGFSLLPGNYVVKLLARDATTGRLGTYLATFTIPGPEAGDGRLDTSSVVLTQQRVTSGAALFTVRQKIPGSVAHPLFQGGQQLVPSVTRTFSRSRPLFVFLEAYAGAGSSGPLAAFATVVRKGAKVFETAPVGFVRDNSVRATPVLLTVPLSDLERGDYECQVTVLDPTGARAAFWRGQIMIGE